MESVGKMSVAGFRARLQELSRTVTQERAVFDTAGRLSDDLYRRLAAIGLFRLWLPVALGGPELSALDFMEVVEEAAALDGAIGWLVGNGGGMGRVGRCRISLRPSQSYATIQKVRRVRYEP
jgi:alkylation response protein AidB-like acyl-CoA dehydrogenase